MPGTLPIVGDFLQVIPKLVAEEQAALNVLHYVVTATAGGGLTLLQIANTLFANWDGPLAAWIPIAASFEDVTVQNITPPRTNPVSSTAAPVPGVDIGNLTPRQVSGLIRTQTAFGGRANRGRVYVGFVAASKIGGAGHLTGGGTASLQAIADVLGPSLVLTIGGISSTLLLQVRHPDLPGPPATPVGTPVVSLQVTALLATQRRRGDFGAANS